MLSWNHFWDWLWCIKRPCEMLWRQWWYDWMLFGYNLLFWRWGPRLWCLKLWRRRLWCHWWSLWRQRCLLWSRLWGWPWCLKFRENSTECNILCFHVEKLIKDILCLVRRSGLCLLQFRYPHLLFFFFRVFLLPHLLFFLFRYPHLIFCLPILQVSPELRHILTAFHICATQQVY